MSKGAPVILTEGLSKRYAGDRGIIGLDLAVERGDVFGFLGPNGSGKTTTIRLLLDLIRPTAGRAFVLGCDVRRDSLAVRRRVGYLPGELSFYGRLSGVQTLRYFAALRGGVDWTYVDELCERLGCDLSRRNDQLSSGNRRKLGLVQALMHRPELLILDEPTAGLDPLVQHEFHQLMNEARAAGQTVFLSSHVLPEVQRVCDRVAFIREARLLAVEDVVDLVGRAVREVEITFAAEAPVDTLVQLPGIALMERSGPHVRLRVTGTMNALVKALAAFEVITLTSREPDLDDVFLAYYGAHGLPGDEAWAAGPPAEAGSDVA